MSKIKKFVSLALVCTMLMSTCACLGGVFSVASSAATPSWTDPTGKYTFPVGPISTDIPTGYATKQAYYDATYGTGTSTSTTAPNGTGGWIAMTGDCYEIKTVQEDILATGNATLTDGYVQPGDYIFTTITLESSANIYLGLSELYAPFDPAFFDYVKTVSGKDLSVTKSNTDIATYAAKMNYDNANVKGTPQLFGTVSTNTSADLLANIAIPTKTGLTTDQIGKMAWFTFVVDYVEGTKVFKMDSGTWFMGFLLKVKDNLEKGTTGAIYFQPEVYKSASKTISFGTVLHSYNPNTILTSTVTLYKSGKTTAKFICEDYGASFVIGTPSSGFDATFYKADNTSVFTTQPSVTTATLPSTQPTKDGYTFEGWATSTTGSAVTFPYSLTASTSFYPVFAPISYTATFHANGENAIFTAGSTTTKEKSIYCDADVTATDIPDPVRTDYNFVGWSLTQSATEKDQSLGTMPASNLDVYAVWSALPTYNYSFKVNTTTVDSGTTTGKVYKYNPKSTEIPEGYTFDGWKKSTGTSAESFTDGYCTISAATTFEAILTPINYNLTWMDNGVVNTTKSKAVAYGAALDYSNPASITGYSFSGYTVEETGGSEIESLTKTPTTTTMPAKNITVKAVYTANTYNLNVYHDKNATSALFTLTLTYNAAIPNINKNDALNNSYKALLKDTAGSVFAGWYNKDVASEQPISTNRNLPFGSGIYTGTNHVNVYATWSSVPVVYFFVSNGNGFSPVSDQTYGSTFYYVNSKLCYFNDGYQEAKWATVYSSAKGQAQNAGISYVEDPTNPRWYDSAALTNIVCGTNGNGFTTDKTISLYLGKASASASIALPVGNPITKSGVEGETIDVELSKMEGLVAGEKFVGIYETSDLTKKIITPSATTAQKAQYTLLAGSHSYTAKFEPITYEVVIKVNDAVVGTTTTAVGQTLDLSQVSGLPAKGTEITFFEGENAKYNKPGYEIGGWETTSGVDCTAPLAISANNISTLGGGKTSEIDPNTGDYIYRIVIKSKNDAKFYTATFVCPEGATFANGETSIELQIATDTTMDEMKAALGNKVKETTGTADFKPVQTGYVFSGFDPNTAMPAKNTTFTAKMSKELYKVQFVLSRDEDGNVLDSITGDAAFGSDKMTVVKDEYVIADFWPSGLDAGRWKANCIFTGWKVTSGSLAEDGTVKEDVVYDAQYKSFNDYLFVLYNSDIASLDAAAGMGTGANASICLTIAKNLKITYWADGKPVSIKEFKCNKDSTQFILFYRLKVIKSANYGKISTEEQNKIIKGALTAKIEIPAANQIAFVKDALGTEISKHAQIDLVNTTLIGQIENYNGDYSVLTPKQAKSVKTAAESNGYIVSTDANGAILSIKETEVPDYNGDYTKLTPAQTATVVAAAKARGFDVTEADGFITSIKVTEGEFFDGDLITLNFAQHESIIQAAKANGYHAVTEYKNISKDDLIALVKEVVPSAQNFNGSLDTLSAEQHAELYNGATAKGYNVVVEKDKVTAVRDDVVTSIQSVTNVSYFAACPFCLNWSFLNPMNFVTNVKLIVTVLKNLIG